MRRAAGIALLLPFLAVALAAHAAPPHDTAFWHTLAAKEFVVPEGESVSALALEAAELLSSPDPKLRDSVAFDALARWVYVQGLVPPDGLEALRLRLQAGLGKGLGESGTDSAYGRSFSALSLSILAATTRYLTAEKDARGFVAGAGWVHAAAHTADVLKFLGQSPKLTPAGQARIVEAVATRLRTAGVVYAWGEDERLALALLSLTQRSDFDPKPFDAWLAALAAENASLWKNGPHIDPAAFVPVRAQRQALVHLAALLAREEKAPEAFRKSLNAALAKLRG